MFNLIVDIIPAAAVLGGGAAAARVAFAKRQTVQVMASHIDSELATRLHVLEESAGGPSWTPDRARAFWAAIGGVRGIPHVLSQARLLLKIVHVIRKDKPEKFGFEQRMLAGASSTLLLATVWATVESMLAVFIPKWRCLGAKMASTLFSHLSAEVENILAEYQYGCC